MSLPENAVMAYRLTAGNMQHLSAFYKNLYASDRATHFTLLIDRSVGVADIEKNIEYLVSVSFHHAFKKINGDNPLFLFEANQEASGNYISTVKKACVEQGYNAIETILIDNNPANIKITSGNAGEVLQTYATAIQQVTSSANIFLFYLDNPSNIADIFNAIEQAEGQLQQNFPQTWHLLKENRALAVKEKEWQVKTTLLEEKLESLTNYHLHNNAPESVYKKQVTELLDFYNTEYEVLPMWFKRLGQVVKVLTGKRTFKSLYNDNVKKYKGS
jgi:ActR/RegA family two-component response regulator